MRILKHFSVHVVWDDMSAGVYEFKSQNAAKAWINGLDLIEVRQLRVMPIWAEPGETVQLEVKYQS